jgi:hypothetical protein
VQWEVGVPLNAKEVRREEVCEDLFGLEAMLLERLTTVSQRDHRHGQAFFELLRLSKKPDETYVTFLDGATQLHQAVNDARGYRPSVKDAGLLVGRLVRLFLKTPSDNLGQAGEKLAEAVGWDEARCGTGGPFLLGVLFRPPTKQAPSGEFGRRILIATYASYQLATAAAHAADYPRFPVGIVESVANDLIRELRP